MRGICQFEKVLSNMRMLHGCFVKCRFSIFLDGIDLYLEFHAYLHNYVNVHGLPRIGVDLIAFDS